MVKNPKSAGDIPRQVVDGVLAVVIARLRAFGATEWLLLGFTASSAFSAWLSFSPDAWYRFARIVLGVLFFFGLTTFHSERWLKLVLTAASLIAIGLCVYLAATNNPDPQSSKSAILAALSQSLRALLPPVQAAGIHPNVALGLLALPLPVLLATAAALGRARRAATGRHGTLLAWLFTASLAASAFALLIALLTQSRAGLAALAAGLGLWAIWLGLGRLHLLEQAGFTLDRLDHLILPMPPSDGARQLLAQLNVPEHKLLFTADDVVYEPQVLLSSSFPGLPRNYPRWLPSYLRRRFGIDGQTAGRRLYVYRSDQYRRRLINEPAILRHLRPLGFEVYDPTGQTDAVRDFAEAALVVSVHAAALGNLVFCPNGTRLLELIPSDHCHPYYYTLAESAGLDYGYLVGPSIQQRPAGSAGPSPFDFTVDEAEFVQALRWLVEGAPVTWD